MARQKASGPREILIAQDRMSPYELSLLFLPLALLALQALTLPAFVQQLAFAGHAMLAHAALPAASMRSSSSRSSRNRTMKSHWARLARANVLSLPSPAWPRVRMAGSRVSVGQSSSPAREWLALAATRVEASGPG